MIKGSTKVELIGKDKKEVQELANAIGNIAKIPQEVDGITNEHIIKLLNAAKSNPQIIVNALNFIG